MKFGNLTKSLMFLTLFLAAQVSAQDQPHIINIPLSNPGEPLTLDISILSARIEVVGEDREDVEFAVVVETSNRKIVTPSGTQPLNRGPYSLEIDEDENYVSVDTDWRADRVMIVAKIPRRADLTLSTTNDGEIIVSNVSGNLELENTNGPITASNISGSIIADAINDTIEVQFSELDGDSAMSLNSMNGDLIFGLPATAGAQFHLDSSQGEIYSDFEVDVQATEPVVQRSENSRGVEVRVESTIVVHVNGGGPVVRMKTLNGDIHIRKTGE